MSICSRLFSSVILMTLPHAFRLYCKHNNDTFSSPEAELLYFLERMRQPGWRWPLNRSPPFPEHLNVYSELFCRFCGASEGFIIELFSSIAANNSSAKFPSDKDSYYCDRDLLQSLVYDARITEWFSKNASSATSSG